MLTVVYFISITFIVVVLHKIHFQAVIVNETDLVIQNSMYITKVKVKLMNLHKN